MAARMLKFSKTISNALAIMARLAKAHTEHRPLRSSELAHQCGLSQPLVSKLMTRLSSARFVSGSPGPGGGYRLTRPPDQIDLAEIIRLFRRLDEPIRCPFGPSCCNNDKPCDLHQKIQSLVTQLIRLLEESTLDTAGHICTAKNHASPP
jgi:Rrf2 family iron-sulfur cluster assembly transcriptional regulator